MSLGSPGSEPVRARVTLWRHLRRAVGRDTGPLSRRSDRARSRLVIGFVLSLPAALVLGVTAAWALENLDARKEAQHRHRISATTVTVADRNEPATRSGLRHDATAEVVWQYPAARQHTGTVEVSADTPVGRKVAIWVDDKGEQALAPHSDPDASAALAGLTTFMALTVASLGIYAVRTRRLEGRALAEWEEEWQEVEPHWSGRLRHDTGPDGE